MGQAVPPLSPRCPASLHAPSCLETHLPPSLTLQLILEPPSRNVQQSASRGEGDFAKKSGRTNVRGSKWQRLKLWRRSPPVPGTQGSAEMLRVTREWGRAASSACRLRDLWTQPVGIQRGQWSPPVGAAGRVWARTYRRLARTLYSNSNSKHWKSLQDQRRGIGEANDADC